MIDRTGSDNAEVAADITITHKVQHLPAPDIGDRLLGSDDWLAQRMARPESM